MERRPKDQGPGLVKAVLDIYSDRPSIMGLAQIGPRAYLDKPLTLTGHKVILHPSSFILHASSDLDSHFLRRRKAPVSLRFLFLYRMERQKSMERQSSMEKQSRIKKGGKPDPAQTTVITRARMLVVGFFVGVCVTRPFMMASNCMSFSEDSADATSFNPPVSLVTLAKKELTSSTEKIRMAGATKNLRANVIAPEVNNMDATTSDVKDNKSNTNTRQEEVTAATATPIQTSVATDATISEIKDSEPKNDAIPEEVLATKTPPILTSLATGNTTAFEINTTAFEIRDFERQDGVVIATKIHGPPHVPQLKQSLCLLNAAYNNRVNYNIVIFTTVPLSDFDVAQLQEIVHPAHLSVETDKQTLSDQINAMTPAQKTVLYQRCNKTLDEPLYWGSRCCEEGSGGSCMPLAYSWQSEFRSKHIWRHKALEKYRYMMWYDSDAMATRVWHNDPVSLMVRNDLAILFANFPQGSTRGPDVRAKIVEAYNGDTLCELKLREGRLFAKGGNCINPNVPQVHGFFHLTNLDFYRSPENLRWADIMIGDTKFSRRWDDQLAVTVPAAMRAPERSWEMEANGVKLDVWHNQFLDGKYRWRGGGYQVWWKTESAESFPEAIDTCQALITNGGR